MYLSIVSTSMEPVASTGQMCTAASSVYKALIRLVLVFVYLTGSLTHAQCRTQVCFVVVKPSTSEEAPLDRACLPSLSFVVIFDFVFYFLLVYLLPRLDSA